jgi:3-isopropylmalate/(R)-2-methylmalate dehydratase large subunit
LKKNIGRADNGRVQAPRGGRRVAVTLLDKLWQSHSIADLGEGFHLLLVDRHLLNDLAGRGFVALNRRNLPVRHPELTVATADHTVATLWNARTDPHALQNDYVRNLRENAKTHGFRFFDVGDEDHGIVHILAAEQGLALPGLTIACGDSHTCTLGAVGALAFGIGQTELVHVLATQTSVQRKPAAMRITLEGSVPEGITAKDIILYTIGRLGVAGAAGYAVEFAGPVIAQMAMEPRFTICNMAVELGARFGLIAPDDVTFAYLDGRPHAPRQSQWQAALQDWRFLRSDPGAAFATETNIDVSPIEPQITWGTSPEQVMGINDRLPVPSTLSGEVASTAQAALDYVGLTAGAPIRDTPVDMVFIGSCVNGRLSDLREAATVARGRRVAPNVTAWVSPGSEPVRRAAEAEGLAQIFADAGFNWGSPGCSMCAGSGDLMREIAAPGQRVVSATNRNFIGRQGPGTRTHLASPAMAAAAALKGCITDVRELSIIDHG